MRRRVEEGSALLAHVLRWFVLATVVGVVVGAATAVFIRSLQVALTLAGQHPAVLFALPLALALAAILARRVVPAADAHTTDTVIAYIHRGQPIPPLSIPKAFLLPILTIVPGGSAGKEAPAADIGAGLGSLLSRLLRLSPEDQRKLMICGVSAGFAAVFGTPIAGAIFGVEVLVVGQLLYDVLLPAFIAGIMAHQVSLAFGLTYFSQPIQVVPQFSEAFFLKVVLAGIFFGLCAFVFVELMTEGRRLGGKLSIPLPVQGLCAGVLLAGASLIVSRQYLGLGLETIESSLAGIPMPWYAFLTKALLTSLTLNFGGSGGIITPVFFVGATAGSAFAQWLHLDPATFAAMGLVSLLAGAANTPIAASILAVELFGSAIAPYAAVACIISFLITGHRSVYPSQILSIRKAPSIPVKAGTSVQHVKQLPAAVREPADPSGT